MTTLQQLATLEAITKKGLTFDPKEIVAIEEKVFHYGDGSVLRYIYKRKNKPSLVIPATAHEQILKHAVNNQRKPNEKVCIQKKGTGKKTKYEVTWKE